MSNSGRNKQYLPYNERRRKAPLHFWAKADNARYCAYMLRRGTCDDEGASTAIGYGGTPHIARVEGFIREAAIALELIVKAAIAQRIESKESAPDVQTVKENHNVLALWNDAGLPAPDNRDKRLLLLVKKILIWSGRYAAPRDDDKYQDDLELDAKFKGGEKRKKSITRLESILTLEWDDFDRLYGIAFNEFVRSRDKFENQFHP